MAVVDIKNLEGKNVGQIDLPDAVFKAKVNPNLLHETVRWYQAAQRAGTHKTKGRGEVSGSGKKLWKQKGTGRARVGSIRSSIWRKGGTVHGPVPRSYAYRLPRKMVLGALRSALSAKLADEKLTVVDAWQLESHKTKPFREALGRLDGATKTMLLVEIAATSFTPSRFRLANSRLRFAAISTTSIVFVAPSRRPSASRNGLVLCDSSCQASTTVSFSSASLAESAERSAPKTILRGSR